MNMGDRIKEIRKLRGLTQAELAQKLGLEDSAIAKYESGRVENIKRSVIFEMAKVLNCSPVYLLCLDEYYTPPARQSSVIQEIIKARRSELGLSVREVAQALNVAPSTISRYESSDIQNMGIDKIEALAKVLRCSPGYLMGWESKVEENPVETANQLSEIFLDQELMETLSIYQSLDADKKKQARDFIYFLKGRS